MPNERIDLAGVRVGHLVAVKPDGYKQTASGSRQYFWLCRCDCGKECRVDGCCLRRATTKSCGCRAHPTKHGMANHPLYGVWCGMRSRCQNPRHKNYRDYGGRGIKVCERWRNSFQSFYEDMGDRPTKTHTIERIDNNADYSPANCRWATRAEQNENSRQTRLLTFKGVTLSLGKWAKRIGIDRKTLGCRLDRFGWSVERALSTPARPIRRRVA